MRYVLAVAFVLFGATAFASPASGGRADNDPAQAIAVFHEVCVRLIAAGENSIWRLDDFEVRQRGDYPFGVGEAFRASIVVADWGAACSLDTNVDTIDPGVFTSVRNQFIDTALRSGGARVPPEGNPDFEMHIFDLEGQGIDSRDLRTVISIHPEIPLISLTIAELPIGDGS